eukprot:547062-Rhodomonas_salina.1
MECGASSTERAYGAMGCAVLGMVVVPTNQGCIANTEIESMVLNAEREPYILRSNRCRATTC